MTSRPGTRPIEPVRRSLLAPLAVATMTVAVAAIAFGGLGRANGGGAPLPSGGPTSSPSPSPSVDPTPAVTPSPRPTRDPSAPPLEVRLTTANGSVIDLDIVDYSLLIESAEAGAPGDGASVDWGTVKVEQLDARTLRLTWVNLVGNGHMWMTLDEAGGRIVLAQPEFHGDTYANDRVLVLHFVEDVAADDFDIVLITSNDADA